MTATVAGRRLFLRCDASTAVGTGHLMRMLALAQAWIDARGNVVAILGGAPPALRDRLVREGIHVEPMAERIGLAAEPLATRLTTDSTTVGAIDVPDLTSADLEPLRASAWQRTLLVDDVAHLGEYPVALVLNQNAHAYRPAYPPGGPAEYLLGLRYALLRREFRGLPAGTRDVPSTATRLLVTFGGADPKGMTARAVDALSFLPNGLRRALVVRVVVGAANEGTNVIARAVARSVVAVTLEQSVSDMRERMAWADLALVSGGSTVWELAAMGCPALIVETAPSEPVLTDGLRQLGLFDVLGQAADVSPKFLAERLARRLTDVDWRLAMARLGPRHVDGRGAERVVRALARLGPSASGPTDRRPHDLRDSLK